jgi:hypothetical protein
LRTREKFQKRKGKERSRRKKERKKEERKRKINYFYRRNVSRKEK